MRTSSKILISGAFNSLKSSKSSKAKLVSWKSSGKLQQTIAACVERVGKTLHSGNVSKVRLCPEFAGRGRYFDFLSNPIPASVDFIQHSPLCTTLCKDGLRIRTVEHLLSALEAMGVDNCKIHIENLDDEERDTEIPIFDGSAIEWVKAVQEVGLKVAEDHLGNNHEKLMPVINEPVHVWKNDAFVSAYPSPEVRVTYGIDFPQVGVIGCQWFSSLPFKRSYYTDHIAKSRTFCIYEDIEKMRSSGLIKGGSLDNALVASSDKGWLNPPLHYHDEPCRHKILDLIGDLSMLAQSGNQGLPVAHIVAYKGGHTLHADLARRLGVLYRKPLSDCHFV